MRETGYRSGVRTVTCGFAPVLPELSGTHPWLLRRSRSYVAQRFIAQRLHAIFAHADYCRYFLIGNIRWRTMDRGSIASLSLSRSFALDLKKSGHDARPCVHAFENFEPLFIGKTGLVRRNSFFSITKNEIERLLIGCLDRSITLRLCREDTVF